MSQVPMVNTAVGTALDEQNFEFNLAFHRLIPHNTPTHCLPCSLDYCSDNVLIAQRSSRASVLTAVKLSMGRHHLLGTTHFDLIEPRALRALQLKVWRLLTIPTLQKVKTSKIFRVVDLQLYACVIVSNHSSSIFFGMPNQKHDCS